MTPTVQPPAPAKPRRRKPGRAVLLHNVDWEMYEKLLEVFAERPGLKLTYDRGELEIMAPSLEHDLDDRILAQFVLILAEELGLPFFPGGSATMRKRKNLKGIEADDIFWIASAAQLAGVKQLDLKVHPPPDLAIEADVSRSSLNRLGIYAALRVPEVWRLGSDTLVFHVLSGKVYADSPTSRSFPIATSADLMVYVQQARAVGDKVPTYRAFREWVRQRVAQQPPPKP